MIYVDCYLMAVPLGERLLNFTIAAFHAQETGN